MSKDKELLGLAAKAAGIDGFFVDAGLNAGSNAFPKVWNPLTDDGDALRLAVRLGLVLNLSPRQDGRGQTVVTYRGVCKIEEPCDEGEILAARRAIVRAAAEIGKDKP